MLRKFSLVALLGGVLVLGGCDMVPDFEALAKIQQLLETPKIPLADKAELPIDPALLGAWTVREKHDTANEKAAKLRFEKKTDNEYLITLVDNPADKGALAFFVQIGKHKILQVKGFSDDAPPENRKWQYMWIKKLEKDEKILDEEFKKGDLIGCILTFVGAPMDAAGAPLPRDKQVAVYRTWISECDFSKWSLSSRVFAVARVFHPIPEKQEAGK